ncbi:MULTISPECIES: phosphate signaling complex protein PhoU [unclassified Mycolicibacterium]|uniref:phosphate signaling complex protein PhoU n=1 Tax=unclassified Mycolicibacterium TaxID=2636767 RepID=UPI002EDA1BDB
MRTDFHQQLDDLKAGIAGLCERTGSAMVDATKALLQADLSIAEAAIGRYADITRECTLLETDAFTILARQAPVAGDLRAVVSALKDVADMQRMGALATHVAAIARRRHPHLAVPEEVISYFAEMGRIAERIIKDTKHVVLCGDPEQAARLRADDEAMDDLHRHLFTKVMDADWTHGIAAAVDVTLLSRYYERFADHAVEVADRVIYQTTGTRQSLFNQASRDLC